MQSNTDDLRQSQYYLPISREDVLESRQQLTVRAIRGVRYLTAGGPKQRQAFWVYFWSRQATKYNYFADKTIDTPGVDLGYPVLIDIDREIIYVQPELCAIRYRKLLFLDYSTTQIIGAFLVLVVGYYLVTRVWLRPSSSEAVASLPAAVGDLVSEPPSSSSS